jgi:hypothetical protein
MQEVFPQHWYVWTRRHIPKDYNLYILGKYSVVSYKERSYMERMLQETVFINKIRKLQRTLRNTIGRRNARVRMTCRTFPIWLERHSSSLLSLVMSRYQFSSDICVFSSENIFFKLFCYIILAMSRQNRVRKLDGIFAVGCGPRTGYL